MANTIIQLKRSSVSSQIPANNVIQPGELAINLADRIIYSKDTSNNIFAVLGSQGSTGAQGPVGAQGTAGAQGPTGAQGPQGIEGDRYKTTSTTTYTLQSNGNNGTITVDLGLAYTSGQTIIVAYDATNHQHGTITSYYPANGELNFVTTDIEGSGTYSTWTVNLDGATGATGPQGPTGAQGPAGNQGPQGVTGAQGPNGPQGVIGVQGPEGNQGPTGAQGPQGVIGTQGPVGSQGPQGVIGAQGPQGNQGTTGVQGPQGNQGPTGTQGPQGVIGTQGPQGNQGPTGTQGPQGNQGVTGSLGPTGPQGPQGVAGTTGAQGPTGNQGSTGTLEFYYQNTLPSSPNVGASWFHSDTGIEYTYTDDGDTNQWINTDGSVLIDNSLNVNLHPFLLLGA